MAGRDQRRNFEVTLFSKDYTKLLTCHSNPLFEKIGSNLNGGLIT